MTRPADLTQPDQHLVSRRRFFQWTSSVASLLGVLPLRLSAQPLSAKS
jgi:hypothetical protein